MDEEKTLSPAPETVCKKCGTGGPMRIKLGAKLHAKHPQFNEIAKIHLNRKELGLVGMYEIQHFCEECAKKC